MIRVVSVFAVSVRFCATARDGNEHVVALNRRLRRTKERLSSGIGGTAAGGTRCGLPKWF